MSEQEKMVQENMVKSLGFYVNFKKNKGAPEESCFGSYLVVLSSIESIAKEIAPYAGFTPDNPLVPLAKINVPPAWYKRIVELIFEDGCAFNDLTIAKVTGISATPQARSAESLSVVPQRRTCFENYLDNLKGDTRTARDVGAILNRMNKVLQEPEKRNRVNGLVVGRVQSGKTRNYVGLMLKARDEGWNVFVVLTSANTLLMKQTQERIEAEFENARAVGGRMLDFHGNDAWRPSPWELQGTESPTFFWSVVMKQADNLERMLAWFGTHRDLAKCMRILVVDDEADNATPDSSGGKDSFLTDEEIMDLAANIRDEESVAHPKELADWVAGLIPRIAEVRATAKPNSENERTIEAICNVFNDSSLKGPQPKQTKIFNNREYCLLLGLETDTTLGVHGSLSDEVPQNLTNDVKNYFNEEKGSGNHSCGKFINLLKTAFEVADERSKISAQVCKLIDRAPKEKEFTYAFDKCAYVAYTATPYANILNETVDETPLYADFMFSLECSPQYFGLVQIFGTDFESAQSRMPIVKAIDADEMRFVLRPMQGIKDEDAIPRQTYDVIVDPSLSYQTRDEDGNVVHTGTWDSLKCAIAWAFCSAGARACVRGTRDELRMRWTTMLMNISQKQGVHKRQVDIIKAFLAHQFETDDGRSEFLGYCRSVWDDMTSLFGKGVFDSLFNDSAIEEGDRYGAIRDLPMWANIEEYVREFINPENQNVHVIVINSGDADARNRYNQTEAYVGKDPGDQLWIVCGGNTISRGLTLAGLTTSYFDRVRQTVSVDTMTQMGRWFGYRPGYELLPRIWMSAETVVEMKKTAVVEDYMHESIREKFEAGISPNQEPENYARIYFWGRQLSGRARAQTTITEGIGTLGGTSGDLFSDCWHVGEVAMRMRRFLASLGKQADRSDTYRYNQFPLWDGVDKVKILEYIKAQAKDSPERTKNVLNALAHEIDRTGAEDPSDLLWDVVVGEPLQKKDRPYEIGVGREIWSVNPPGLKVKANKVFYSSVRSDPAFYAMIRKMDFVSAEAEILREQVDNVVEELENAVGENGGVMPSDWASALKDFPGTSNTERVLAFLNKACEHPESVPVTDDGELLPCFRNCMPQGYRNRSSTEYREKVYEKAGFRRPVLQIYLLTPSGDAAGTSDPMVIHAFYWANHTPDEFNVVSVGLPMSEKKGPSPGKFGTTVADVLKANDFPMRSGGEASKGGGLREKVVDLLAADGCDAVFYNMNISKNLWGAPYKAMPAPHSDCYYYADWAEDPIAKIRGLILQWALEVLADHQVHEERLLAQAVVAAHPQLIGVYPIVQGQDVVMVTDDWREIFTDEVLEENGIEKVSGNPIMYRLKPEKEEVRYW